MSFDLNYNRIYNYSHLGEDIGVDESKRCTEELTELINDIKWGEKVDSPFYEYISRIEPSKISEKQVQQLINHLGDKDDTLFAIVEKAKILKSENKFKKAAEYWKSASEKKPNE